jgi:hypothetical protein
MLENGVANKRETLVSQLHNFIPNLHRYGSVIALTFGPDSQYVFISWARFDSIDATSRSPSHGPLCGHSLVPL